MLSWDSTLLESWYFSADMAGDETNLLFVIGLLNQDITAVIICSVAIILSVLDIENMWRFIIGKAITRIECNSSIRINCCTPLLVSSRISLGATIIIGTTRIP